MSSQQRIGILGGAFDPVHVGHLILASEAQEFLALDRVILVPGAQTPLKGRAPGVPGEVRLAMLAEAVRHRPDWEVCDWEIRRGGVSYSLHTAAHLKARFPEAALFWIIGADQLARLPFWYKIEELGVLVRFAVAVRNGDRLDMPEGLPASVQVETLPARRIDISSGEVRERLRAGRLSADFLLPECVRRHIEAHGLYRD